LFSQNITNTLGSSGSFIVKDGTTTFLTLDQAAGHLTLNNVAIFQGANRFLHNFGTENTFLGINSGNFTMTGTDNTALGVQSLLSNTTGHWNTAIGVNSLYNNLVGGSNTAVGLATLQYNTSGNANTAIGVSSLSGNTTGVANTAVGANSLQTNATGGYNTAVGLESLYSNADGDDNTALGYYALYKNLTGYQNTALGSNSLSSNIVGNQNTALGYAAGVTITNGDNLTCLGYYSQPSTSSATDQITLGNNSITSLRCNVTSISSLSDMRDKKNIKDLDLGIDFLMKIKPRQFNWDKREWYENNKSDGSKMKEEPTAGFIAQELDSTQTSEKAEWLNLVLKDNPEKLEATSGNLLPIIVKAIQDLKKENDELQIANNELKTTNVELTSRLNKFEQMQNMLVSEIEKIKTNSNETTKVSLGEK
jgi:hypothetical protein